jgi:hypothetical protein
VTEAETVQPSPLHRPANRGSQLGCKPTKLPLQEYDSTFSGSYLYFWAFKEESKAISVPITEGLKRLNKILNAREG